jgi:hypothetical protein
MRFAKRLFTAAGLYGLVVLGPHYFLEDRLGRDLPPPITHPEYFYGFVGVALAWQVLFLMLGRDPLRYRPLMLPCVVEKITYGLAVIVLFFQARVAPVTLITGLIDLVLATLFVTAYVKTGSPGFPPPSLAVSQHGL